MKKLFTSLLASLILLASFDTSGQKVGTKAPDFVLNQLGGGQFKLSDHSGKVVFIFFFGYACPHCLSNGPNTQSGIYEKYKNNSAFVAVGVDTWDGNESGVSNFKSSTGITYTLCLKASSLEGLYQTSYDRIVVVDKDGFIRYKSSSDATTDIVSVASDTIKTYLAKEATGGDGGDGGDGGNGGDGGDGGTITAIDDMDEEEKIELYPVPAQNELTLKNTSFDNKAFTLKIIDAVGKTVLEDRFQAKEQISISIDQLRNGVYFLQLQLPGETLLKKFVVRR